ncbi:hypothetical protein JNUCC75_05530 [Bifidobacterium polysaccharolyticum]
MPDRAKLSGVLNHHLEPLEAHEFALRQRDRGLVVEEGVNPPEQREITKENYENEKGNDEEPKIETVALGGFYLP